MGLVCSSSYHDVSHNEGRDEDNNAHRSIRTIHALVHRLDPFPTHDTKYQQQRVIDIPKMPPWYLPVEVRLCVVCTE